MTPGRAFTLTLALASLLTACGGDEEQPPATDQGSTTSTATSADTSNGQDLLSNIGFSDESQFQWHRNNEQTQYMPRDGIDPERARIQPKSQIYRQVSVLQGREGVRHRLSLQARMVETQPIRLRLQVTWLPQGGWKAREVDGVDLVRNDIEVVDVDSYGWESHTFEVQQAPQAVDAVVYIVNAGPDAVDVANIRFERLDQASSGR